MARSSVWWLSPSRVRVALENVGLGAGPKFVAVAAISSSSHSASAYAEREAFDRAINPYAQSTARMLSGATLKLDGIRPWARWTQCRKPCAAQRRPAPDDAQKLRLRSHSELRSERISGPADAVRATLQASGWGPDFDERRPYASRSTTSGHRSLNCARRYSARQTQVGAARGQ